MTGIVEVSSNVANDTIPTEWPGIVSRFQLVILATHRNKQLLLGAQPRIVADRLKRRNTSIAQNAGSEGSIVVEKVRADKNASFGFNAATESYGDLVQQGVIDPTKVARTALQNAASIASLLLTTEAVVTEVPEKKEKATGAAMPGGADMDY